MALKQSWYHILLTLADGTLHGAEIHRKVSDHTGGRVTLYPVTLYGALEDMVAVGLIAETRAPADAAPRRERRRYYRVTKRGRQALADETAQLEATVRLARQALGRGRSS